VTKRPEYPLRITINERVLTRVVISQHYKENHAESITDEIILELVKELDGGTFVIERSQDGFECFKADRVVYQSKTLSSDSCIICFG